MKPCDLCDSEPCLCEMPGPFIPCAECQCPAQCETSGRGVECARRSFRLWAAQEDADPISAAIDDEFWDWVFEDYLEQKGTLQ